MPKWILVIDELPPENIDVLTKLDDSQGVRNTGVLRLHNGLWWFADMSMYVYYTPTHWAYK